MDSLPKKILASFFRQMLFWLLVLELTRLVFVFYNLKFLRDIPVGETAGVFWYSLPLDVSAICYIMVLPFFFLVIQNFYTTRWLEIAYKTYVFIVLFLLLLITSVEAGIYSEWKMKLHYKALQYLLHPDEIAASAQSWQILVITLLILLQTLLYYFLYLKIFYYRVSPSKKNYLFSLFFVLLTPGLLFLGMRGGLQQIPINQSQSYFSKHDILNCVSVNSLWNFGHSIADNYSMLDENPFEYYSKEEACAIVSQMFSAPADSSVKVLKNNHPNVVMFILEGWSADLIESLGGEAGITPFFRKLEKNGILFTNIYTNGTRSQEGMSAIFSGFPAQGITAVSQQPGKYQKLPGLIQKLKPEGYFSSFYFGGQLIYGNIKSYLVYNGFDQLIEESDFPASMPRGKLGLHDEFTFPYFLKGLNSQKQPFFSALFTMSTHSPYDYDKPQTIMWPEYEKKYVNAANYADGCLKDFFTEAQKEKWYDNTLFILISDHCHGSYRNHPFYSPDYHKIVMLWCGNVIKDEFMGSRVEKIGSQTDLPALLLSQLEINHDEFNWSKNLWQPSCPEFAFFAYNGGFGLVKRGAQITYETVSNSPSNLIIDTTATITEQELLKQAQSYMQCSFQQYMDF